MPAEGFKEADADPHLNTRGTVYASIRGVNDRGHTRQTPDEITLVDGSLAVEKLNAIELKRGK